MKKSETYYLAQIAVVTTPSIAPENKLEILRVLFEQEEFEQFREERDVIELVNEELEGAEE